MGTLRALVTIPRDNGLSRDAVANTFHFGFIGALVGTEGAEVHDLLLNFYNANGSTAGSNIAQYLSGGLNAPTSRLKVYDLADAEPRVPLYDNTLAITANASTNHLPSEVAVCLSFKALPESGVPARRQRGRVYIGPLSQGAMASGTSNDARPLSQFQSALLDAGVRLRDKVAIAGGGTLDWVVASHVGGLNTYPVNSVWVDDAFDTQRRRGLLATTRITG
jgi:hypothetical protein